MKEEYVEQTFQVVSKTPISLFFNEHLSKVYDSQLNFGIQLPIDVYPEKSTCINGYPFHNLKRARSAKGIIIYTETDIISLPNHQGKPLYLFPQF